MLYVHLSHAAVTVDGIGTARLENGNQLITAGQVRDWCHTAGSVVVKPVLDLEAHDPVDSPRRTGPARRDHHRAGQDLCVPLVHPPRPPLRHRPHHPAQPRRTHLPVQPGPVVPTTSPDQDPRPLDLHHPRTRPLPLDQPARLPVPPRPRRHPRRQRRPTWFRDRRCAPSSTTEPTRVATKPRTPPTSGAIGTPCPRSPGFETVAAQPPQPARGLGLDRLDRRRSPGCLAHRVSRRLLRNLLNHRRTLGG